MKSSVKLKFNSSTGETELTNSEGVNLLEHFPFVTDIQVAITSTGIPKLTLTYLCFDELEIESDKADIELSKLEYRYIKEKKND